jgi:hypothetical protein
MSSMFALVMRETSATENTPSVNVGRMRLDKLSAPAAGSHCSFTENTMISRRPSQ